MARPLRVELEGAFYHVTSRGNDRRKIFLSKRDYEKFKEYLGEAKQKYRFILHGFVLMTNHYHLLIETPEKNLSKIMHYINSSYTTYSNVKKNRAGHLFQGRFKSILVDKDSYLLELSRYVHLNPVRAKVVEKPEGYPFSSYTSYLSVDQQQLVSSQTILGMLSNKDKEARKRYKTFVEAGCGAEVSSPLNDVYGGFILGGEQFIRGILGKIEEGQIEKEHVSYRRSLRAPYEAEQVLSTVCQHYGMSLKEAATWQKGRIRKICLYLLKKHTVATTREIGVLVGGMKYEAAAKLYQRFCREVTADRQLQKEIQQLSRHLSNVQG